MARLKLLGPQDDARKQTTMAAEIPRIIGVKHMRNSAKLRLQSFNSHVESDPVSTGAVESMVSIYFMYPKMGDL